MLTRGMKRLRKLGIARGEKGFTLIETVAALALLGIIAAGLFSGLGTNSKVLHNTDTQETAKNLAETQLEFVKGQSYVPNATTYTAAAIPAAQFGYYTATITAVDGSALSPPRDGNIQKIIVAIKLTKNGQTIYTLEGYKVR
jgi:prepilin-type N-terminal cleavage/methylation domain-containing protein